jgi:hypothetical protein
MKSDSFHRGCEVLSYETENQLYDISNRGPDSGVPHNLERAGRGIEDGRLKRM